MSTIAARRAAFKAELMSMHRLVGSNTFLSMNRAGVQEKSDQLTIIWAKFQKEHDDLVNLLGSSERERLEIVFKEVRDIHEFIRRAFHRRMNKLNTRVNPNDEVAPNHQNVVPVVRVEENIGSNDQNERNIMGPIRNNHRLASIVQRVGSNDLRLRLMNRTGANIRPRFNPYIMCYNCGSDHPIRKCPRWENMSITRMTDQLNNLRLCNNCLGILGETNHSCPHKHCGRCGVHVFHNSILCPRNPENSHKL